MHDSKLYPQGIRGVKAKYASNGDLVFYGNTGQEIHRLNARMLKPAHGDMLITKRFRASVAEVNAGGFTVIPAVPGFAASIVDWTMIAIGGNAATATSVDLVGTRGASAVRPAVVAVAALTRSTAVKPNSSNVTLLADGASHTALDANTAVTLEKQSGGSNLATATHVDLIVSYKYEAA